MAEEAKPLAPEVAQDLARLAQELAHNPETRKDFGKLVKKAKPQSSHAAAFKDVEIEDQFEAFKAEQEQKELKQQQNAIVARMNAQRAALMTGGEDGSGRKYNEDDVKKIEALMEKKGLTDYEDAAILYAATLPPPSPQPPSNVPVHGTTWEMPEFAKFGKDPVRASREVANDVITELMHRKRA
jgi:hypothetical protein